MSEAEEEVEEDDRAGDVQLCQCTHSQPLFIYIHARQVHDVPSCCVTALFQTLMLVVVGKL